jgi:hypothetical protein
MALLYLVVKAIIYGPIQSVGNVAQVCDFLTRHKILEGKSSQETIYLRCLSTDAIVTGPETSVASGIYQVCLGKRDEEKEASDPVSILSLSRSYQDRTSKNPFALIRNALCNANNVIPNSSSLQLDSITQLMHVIRYSVPILEQIDMVLHQVSSKKNDESDDEEGSVQKRPSSWKKRISSITDSRFQPGKSR